MRADWDTAAAIAGALTAAAASATPTTSSHRHKAGQEKSSGARNDSRASGAMDRPTDAEREQVGVAHLAPAFGLFAATEHALEVGTVLEFQQAAFEEPAEQRQDFVLAGHLLAQFDAQHLPQLSHRASPVAASDEGMALDCAVNATARLVAQYRFRLCGAGARAAWARKARMQAGNPVPQRTEDGLAHVIPPTATTGSGSSRAAARPARDGDLLPTRSWQRPAAPDADRERFLEAQLDIEDVLAVDHAGHRRDPLDPHRQGVPMAGPRAPARPAGQPRPSPIALRICATTRYCSAGQASSGLRRASPAHQRTGQVAGDHDAVEGRLDPHPPEGVLGELDLGVGFWALANWTIISPRSERASAAM